MTDSFDPQAARPPRKKPRREPATIDLEAKVVDDGRPADPADGETERLVSEAMAETEPALDAAAGTDSIAPAPEADTLSGGPTAPGGTEAPPPPPPPPQAEPGRRTSPAALVGAGLLGGLVGAGLLYGLQAWQKPSAPPGDPRLAQLEQRVAALGQPANAQGLENRLKALEEATKALDSRLKAAEAAARQAEARAGEALDRPVPESPAPQDEAAVKNLADRLAALEGQLQAQGEAVRQAERSGEAAQQAVEALGGRLDDDARQIAALAGKVGQGPDAATLAAVRLSLASRLGDALRRGVPYSETLSALERLSKDPGRLAPLKPFAGEGAPTASDLARAFEPLRAAILRDDRGAGTGSWTDRLWRMADRIVTVRPVGEAGGTGVPATLARIDRALDRGDVAGALAAWRSLPEPSRRLSEEWGRRLQARAEAEAALQAVADDALSALPQTPPTTQQ
ncbi:COG4223 family protein [Microvirga thermotolerans]|uniref:Uncharacterized protein n=1 Tax=Microvirga thermotolerans TaxID=2651334 RepID=A0A5P9JSP0_9HYPH|nr:hypothetical protein [Microvirga thermotolerans]QFU15111.1 hypothetical protein GDR74_02155 [Microvirga thermotolerans]